MRGEILMDEYIIKPNDELITKAKVLLSTPMPTSFEEKLSVCSNLDNMLKEIFEYREKTFSEALNYLSRIPIVIEKREVTIILNHEIDEIINSIFQYQQKIFNPDL